MEDDASSPVKQKEGTRGKGEALAKDNSTVNRQLFQARKVTTNRTVRKRKSKPASPDSPTAPDLNILTPESLTLVPVGLVSTLVGQIQEGGRGVNPMVLLRMS